MFPALLLGVGLLAADPSSSTSDLNAYQAARDAVGRDPSAHVKLALWCEAHGLSSERVRHLALAVLSDPKNATARGLMGLVAYRGRWARPEEVSAKVKADEALTAKLAEYNGRRYRAGDSAEAQWKLALWCEEVGLDAEARAHLATVVRLDPSREAAWKHLGYKKVGQRWTTEARLAAERAEADAQRKANQVWKPLLTKWRTWLRDKDRSAEATEALTTVDDPRAVPSVLAVFAAGDDSQQGVAVQVLGRVESPAASRALATLAIYGRSPMTRRAAAETLKRRDFREFVDLLVGLLRDPIKYEVRPVGPPGSPGELFVEGERYNVRRLYGPVLRDRDAPPPRVFADSVPFDPFSEQNLLLATQSRGVDAYAAQRDLQIARQLDRIQSLVAVSQQQMNNDVAALDAYNADAKVVNGQTRSILTTLTAQDLGDSPKSWGSWWADQKGYALRTPKEPPVKPTFTTFVENPYATATTHSCFGAGTPVRTLDGPKPIEAVRTGDQVLSQDATTGRLSYTPVVAVYHNRPAPTVKVALGGESVVATGIHRFWKAGHGWVMARELKPGDSVRTLGGTARVASVESDTVRPVFNLEVADGQSFFVGESGVLVHDNSLVEPVPSPFDAPPELASIAKGAR